MISKKQLEELRDVLGPQTFTRPTCRGFLSGCGKCERCQHRNKVSRLLMAEVPLLLDAVEKLTEGIERSKAEYEVAGRMDTAFIYAEKALNEVYAPQREEGEGL